MPFPSFAKLWENHPNVKGTTPLLDKGTYPDQCAVNMYAALQGAGANLSTFRGQMSWQKDKPKYAIRAQELANWLATAAGGVPARVEKYPGKEVFDDIKGRSGIIFFQHYWGPSHQGNHMDLYNGSRLTDWFSWVRIVGHVHWEGHFSEFRNSQSVWFWPIP